MIVLIKLLEFTSRKKVDLIIVSQLQILVLQISMPSAVFVYKIIYEMDQPHYLTVLRDVIVNGSILNSRGDSAFLIIKTTY